MVLLTARPNRPTRTIPLPEIVKGKRRSMIVRSGETWQLPEAEAAAVEKWISAHGLGADYTLRAQAGSAKAPGRLQDAPPAADVVTGAVSPEAPAEAAAPGGKAAKAGKTKTSSAPLEE